jgi:hypothetical protein
LITDQIDSRNIFFNEGYFPTFDYGTCLYDGFGPGTVNIFRQLLGLEEVKWGDEYVMMTVEGFSFLISLANGQVSIVLF